MLHRECVKVEGRGRRKKKGKEKFKYVSLHSLFSESSALLFPFLPSTVYFPSSAHVDGVSIVECFSASRRQ